MALYALAADPFGQACQECLRVILAGPQYAQVAWNQKGVRK
jgi:hypothetical protein